MASGEWATSNRLMQSEDEENELKTINRGACFIKHFTRFLHDKHKDEAVCICQGHMMAEILLFYICLTKDE